MISYVEEITLFQDVGVKSFFIIDNLDKKKTLSEVGYRIELVVDTNFGEYVDYVISQADQSLRFLTSYLNSLTYTDRYDGKQLIFNPDFTARIMNSLGLSTNISRANLNTKRIKDSDFGKAAISYYNTVLLLSPNIGKDVYSTVLKTILPTDKTSPTAINMFIRNFSSVLESAKFEYLKTRKQDKKEKSYSKVSTGKTDTSMIHATSKERLKIEQHVLGYSLFSNNPGLNLFSSAEYKTRWALEQARYYPSINAEDESNFMTQKEKGDFMNTSNAPAFLTPISFLMGDKRIKTDRGLNNVNIDDIRQFRLAKSVRYQNQISEKNYRNSGKNLMSIDSLSSLNVTISTPKPSLLSRATYQEVDTLIDAKYYVGTGIDFTTGSPIEIMKNFKRILTSKYRRALAIVYDIIPQIFLRDDRAIKSIEKKYNFQM